jgi:thiol:disulfide interchange protein DsbA
MNRKQPEKKNCNKLIYAVFAVLILAAAGLYFSSISASDNKQDIFQPTEPGKVKIVEFLKFDCIHCYNLHKELPGILKKYGDNVSIAYVPIVFPGQSTKSIEAYLISEQMGKGEEMKDALFTAKFVNGMDIMENSPAIETVASSIGLGADFNSKLEGNEAKKAAQSNLALMNKYNIQGTPTVYINGKQIIPIPTNIDTNISSMLG